MSERPFWEEEYKNHSQSTFGEPCSAVRELLPLLSDGAEVLDIGCGDGRNSLFLAEMGYSVDAFDISENAIEKLSVLRDTKNLRLNCWCQDVLHFNFTKKYDLILCHGLLQFLSPSEISGLIRGMKGSTKKNGFNVVAVFEEETLLSSELKAMVMHLFESDELGRTYCDWFVLSNDHYEKDESTRYNERTILHINKISCQKK